MRCSISVYQQCLCVFCSKVSWTNMRGEPWNKSATNDESSFQCSSNLLWRQQEAIRFPRMHRKSSLFMRLFMHVELDWLQLFVSCLNWTLQQSENVWQHKSASRDKTNKSIYYIIISYSIIFHILLTNTCTSTVGAFGKTHDAYRAVSVTFPTAAPAQARA